MRVGENLSRYNAIKTHKVYLLLKILRLQILNLKQRVQDHPEETLKL